MSDVQSFQVAVPVKEVRAWCRAKYGADWWKKDKPSRTAEARTALTHGEGAVPSTPTPLSDIRIATLEAKVQELLERVQELENPSVPNDFLEAGDKMVIEVKAKDP